MVALSFSVVLFQSSEQIVSVVWRVVVNHIRWIVTVDFVNVLTEFAARFSLNFLNLLESSRLHECAFGFKVLREHFSELSADVLKNVVRSQLKKGLKCRQVGAHLNDILKGFLCFVF